MRERKIQTAVEYVRARARLLDPFQPHHADERFETPSGDYCCVRFDQIPFEGVGSVQQVFDTLLAYSLNIEIIVSEQLGLLTVREDYDSVDASIMDFRLLTTQCGAQVESHIAVFAQYFERHALTDNGPCGVVVMDSVDDDELYPYCPSSRVRKDVSHAMVLSRHTRERLDGDGDETVVVLHVAKFLTLHRAEFALSRRALHAIRNGMCWAPVMVTTINELLYPEFAGPSSEL